MSIRYQAMLWSAVACQLSCAPPRDAIAPTVALTAPASGATSVPVTSVVSVAFSESVEPASLATAFTVSGASGTVAVTGTAATFTPDAPLSYGTSYTAAISTGAMDLAGNALAAEYSWTFTTALAPDSTAPTVSLTVPASDATDVPVESALAVAFSELIDPATVNAATFTVAGVDGGVSATGTTATFTPSAPFAFGTLYSATVSTGVTDAVGNALAAPFTWSFTTQPDPCLLELSCSPPSNGGNEICISGRVVLGDDLARPIDGTQAQQITVSLYEPIAFISNPITSPLQTLSVTGGGLDVCGRYATRIDVSSLPGGSVAITTFGKAGTPGQAAYVLGTAVRRVIGGVNLTNAIVPLVSTALDQAWSTAAGLAGPTFAARGTLAVRYHQGGTEADLLPGTPIGGVVPLWNGLSAAANDYFFSDSAPTTLTTIGPGLGATGVDGITLLALGTGLGNVSAGTACLLPAGGSGTLSVVGSTLAGSVAGAIILFEQSVTCSP